MKKILGLLFITVMLFSCDSDNSEGGNTGGGSTSPFDRGTFLINLVDNNIIPSYEAFAVETALLKTATTTFTSTPTIANLEALRAIWLKAYKIYQPVAIYDLGKGLDIAYILYLNSHPLRLDKTLEDIKDVNFDVTELEISTNQNRQGFPALDYLINGLATTDADIVAVYTGAEAANYKRYINAVSNRIDALTNTVLADWKGDFKTTFVTNTAGDKSGSFNEFLNVYVQYLEKRLRASKLGIPAGQFTESAFPEQIESLYKPEESRGLMLEALAGFRKVYEGVDGDDQSFSEVLKGLGNSELNNKILVAFDNAKAAIETLDVNLKKQIQEDRDKAKDVRKTIQRLVVLMKNDMVTALGGVIVFQDGDGD